MARSEIIAIWFLRAVVLGTSVMIIGRGEWVFGMFCVLAVVLSLVPTLAAHSAKAAWPPELELLLLWFLLMHVTFGNLLDLYTHLAWFDKALHLGDSAMIGFVAFLAVYVGHFLRHERAHPWLDGFAILLATLGLGAMWEITEYAYDHLFGSGSQGSPTLSPIDDTMWDLILDGVGGVIAAIAGPIYMHHSKRSRARVAQFAEARARRVRRQEDLRVDPFDASRTLGGH